MRIRGRGRGKGRGKGRRKGRRKGRGGGGGAERVGEREERVGEGEHSREVSDNIVMISAFIFYRQYLHTRWLFGSIASAALMSVMAASKS